MHRWFSIIKPFPNLNSAEFNTSWSQEMDEYFTYYILCRTNYVPND